MGHVPVASKLCLSPQKNTEINLASSLASQDWYFGKISEKEAEDYLLDPMNMKGTFLIRKAERGHQGYVLSIREGDYLTNDVISHHRIRKNCWNEGFVMVSSPYETLVELVERCQKRKPTFDVSCFLEFPCSKIKYEAECRAEHTYHSESDTESVELDKRIGEGSMGEVWKGRWNGKEVAVRKVRKENTSIEDFIEEAKLMKTLFHENVLALYTVCIKDDPVFIVLEYMNKGTLRRVLAMDKGLTLKLTHLLNFARQVASGMEYLESLKLVHGGLLARNILVDEGNTCKIADFGLARVIKEGRYYNCNLAFVYRWAAPEVIKSQRNTCESDVWSFGMVVMEILAYGETLYQGMRNRDLMSKLEGGYRMPKPSNCPEDVYKVLLRCWDLEPGLRPSFFDLRSFFEQNQGKSEVMSEPTNNDSQKVTSSSDRSKSGRRRTRRSRYFSSGSNRKPSDGDQGIESSCNEPNIRGRLWRNFSRENRGGKTKEDRSDANVNCINRYESYNDDICGKSYSRTLNGDCNYRGRGRRGNRLNRGIFYGRFFC